MELTFAEVVPKLGIAGSIKTLPAVPEVLASNALKAKSSLSLANFGAQLPQVL